MATLKTVEEAINLIIEIKKLFPPTKPPKEVIPQQNINFFTQTQLPIPIQANSNRISMLKNSNRNSIEGTNNDNEISNIMTSDKQQTNNNTKKTSLSDKHLENDNF